MFRMMSDMEKKMEAQMGMIEGKIVKEIVNNPILMHSIMAQVVREVEKVQKGDKGDDAYTPKKGVDYFTPKEIREITAFIESRIRIPKDGRDGEVGRPGRDGIDGKELVAGKDYPTPQQVSEMVKNEVYTLFSFKPKNDKIITKEEVIALTGKLQEKVDFKERAAEIARALETLRGGEQLDYYSLKNRPVPKDDKQGGGRIYARGGGSEVKEYDLSGETDGSTKSFTIPANKRIVAVLGSDFPVIYRKTTDYTGTGTTTLQLTSEVAAPSSGSTLSVIYVPH